MLSEKQLELIELLVSGEHTVKDACESVGVSRMTYYDWRKGHTKVGKEFNKAYDEALELKVKESRRFVKTRVNNLLKSLMDITDNGKNENAKVNAVAKLLHYGDLDPSDKQELTIKGDDDNKNALLEMWKQKKQESNEDE